MKNVLKVILLVVIAGLVYICFRSIMNPIEFKEVRENREEVVIKRLVDIKKAQEEYYSQNSKYAEDFETLIDFVKTGKKGIVKKTYELSDEQQAYLLTLANETIAKENKKRRNSEKVEEFYSLTSNQADSVFLVVLAEAKEKDDWKVFDAIEKKKSPHQTLSLKEFSRDTTWLNLLDTLYHSRQYPVDSLEFIPFGNGEKFVMETNGRSGSGALFEAYADSKFYLEGISKQELDNYLLEVKKNNRPVRKEYHKDEEGNVLRDTEGKEIFDVIPCLKIGDKKIPNKNAGNWE